MDKIILTDVDGVLSNWEFAFVTWMERHGHKEIQDGNMHYGMAARFQMSESRIVEFITTFNESAAIGFLPALRDATYYVKRLHEEHRYHFHVVSSLGTDDSSQSLRTMNLKKIFGKNTFIGFDYMEVRGDKSDALRKFENSGYHWVEDNIENVNIGCSLGLDGLLMEHGHNMDYDGPAQLVKHWQEIYHIVTEKDEI